MEDESRSSASADLRRLEAILAIKFAGVSLIGFLVDLAVLQILLHLGLEPAWSRVVSLLCAMHVTFLINGLVVFRRLTRRLWLRQWMGYLTTNGFGNFCNYWVFLTMVSTHWQVVSVPWFAAISGSLCAWGINYAANRFIVFRGGHPKMAAPR